jgi:hypothetical protein
VSSGVLTISFWVLLFNEKIISEIFLQMIPAPRGNLIGGNGGKLAGVSFIILEQPMVQGESTETIF